MRLLKFHLISLLFALALLFNIERLDLNTENALNIQTFVYVLALFITIVIIFLPVFSQYRVPVAIAFALGLYIVCKLLFAMDRPVFGGISTYVTILTEATFLAVIASISQRLSQSLYEFQLGFETMTLNWGGTHLQTVAKAEADIRREITRSRHYHRPLSVIVIEPDPQSLKLALPNIFEELQQGIINRFARVKLAQAIQKHLRLMDLILEEDNNRFIILCPELDNQGSAVITDRVKTVMSQVGITAHFSAATFPEDALTFEGLVNQAKTKLPDSAALHKKPTSQTPDIIY